MQSESGNAREEEEQERQEEANAGGDEAARQCMKEVDGGEFEFMRKGSNAPSGLRGSGRGLTRATQSARDIPINLNIKCSTLANVSEKSAAQRVQRRFRPAHSFHLECMNQAF
eukprot:13990735-Alexandrium_andersonii.AAC.1